MDHIDIKRRRRVVEDDEDSILHGLFMSLRMAKKEMFQIDTVRHFQDIKMNKFLPLHSGCPNS